jgi:glucose/arabinose dehydrogenase
VAILPKAAGIIAAALIGAAAVAALAQSQPVLTGTAAYGDWRSDAPGLRRKIAPADMPPPYATASANRGPAVVARPADAWPKAPPGFVVELLAGGLDNPRLIRVSPSGDIFVAESRPGRLRVLRPAKGAVAAEIRTFAEDLYQPFGIAFWPSGPNPRYVYVANTDSVIRFPYHPVTCSRRVRRRRSSPGCRGADIGRAMSSSRPMMPACSSQSDRAATPPTVGSMRRGSRMRAAPRCSPSPPRQGQAGLRDRSAQLRRDGGAAGQRRALVLGQRARRPR